MRVRPRVWSAVVGVLVLAGVWERVWVLRGRWGVVDSDEAVVGLMARAFRHGHWQAFYWGQHYAGSLEPALVALFGASGTALKLVPVGLAAITSVLIWRFGRRVIDERLAQLAACLFWLAPGAYVWWSTKERGFYWASIALGVLLLLSAARLLQEKSWKLDGLVFGLAAGVGFWVSPTVLYFAVPAGVWIVARRSPPLRWLAIAVPAAVVGAFPWLWHNVGHGFPSLNRPVQDDSVSYLGGIRRLATKTMPIALNLRYPISDKWLHGHLGQVLYLLLGAALVVAFVVRRRDRPVVVFGALALYPFVYAWFPGAWFVGEGRYALFAAPFLALAIAWLFRRPEAVVAVCVVAALVSVAVLQATGAESPRYIGEDLAALRSAGVDHVWGNYWYAYRLGFVSGGWLTAAPVASSRDKRLYNEVLRSDHPAFLYPKGDARVAQAAAVLHPVRTVHTPHFDVLVLDRRVNPRTLPGPLWP